MFSIIFIAVSNSQTGFNTHLSTHTQPSYHPSILPPTRVHEKTIQNESCINFCKNCKKTVLIFPRKLVQTHFFLVKMVQKPVSFFTFPIFLSSLLLYGGGLPVYHSLFLSQPLYSSLLLHHWLSLIADSTWVAGLCVLIIFLRQEETFYEANVLPLS